MSNDGLNLDALQKAIGENAPKSVVLDLVDSTNEYAKRMAGMKSN